MSINIFIILFFLHVIKLVLGFHFIDTFENEKVALSCDAPTKNFNDFIVTWHIPKSNVTIASRRTFIFTEQLNKPEIESGKTEEIAVSGGNANGGACAFPFITKDEHTSDDLYHFTCIDSGRTDSKCWCSTTHNFTSGKTWGFCPCPTPIKGVTLYAEYGTSPGVKCHFPFKYKGKVYKSCTSDHKNQCWCGTTFDVDTDDNWGYCSCHGPALIGSWAEWSEWTVCRCGEVSWKVRTCMPPKELKQVVLGRQVHCLGRSILVRMCKCEFYGNSIPQYAIPVVNAMKRSKVLNNSIEISQLKAFDSGAYTCKKISHITLKAARYKQNWDINKGTVDYDAHLNIKKRSDLKVILLDKNETILGDFGKKDYRVIWRWSNWTNCDRCEEFGEKLKYGFCYVRHSSTNFEFVPCSSSLLNPLMLARVGKLPNYMLVKVCKVPCFSSNILVSIYESFFPTLPPPAKRYSRAVRLNDRIKLPCTSGPIANHTYAWHFDDLEGKTSVPIRRHDRQKQFLIDNYHNLHVVTARKTFAGYFGCYVDQKLSISYRLFITDETPEAATLVLSNIGFFSVFIFIYVFCLIGYRVWKTNIPK